MSLHTIIPSYREHRLLMFADLECPSVEPISGFNDDTKRAPKIGEVPLVRSERTGAMQEKRTDVPPALRSLLQMIGKEAPTFKRVLEADTTTLDAIAASDETITLSEDALLLKKLIWDFLKKIDEVWMKNSSDGTRFIEEFRATLNEFNEALQRVFVAIGSVRTLEALSQVCLEDEVGLRRTLARNGTKMTGRGQSFGAAMREAFREASVPSAAQSDLIRALKAGKSLAAIRAQYTNVEDLQKMNAAIDNLGKIQNELMKNVLGQYNQQGSSHLPGLTVELDPEDYDIRVTLTEESLQFIQTQKPEDLTYRDNGNGTIDLAYKETSMRLHRIRSSPLAYRVELPGEKPRTGAHV